MALALAVALGAADGCEDMSGLSGGGNCDMDTGESSLLGTLTATYFASGTGDATMSSLSYTTDDGSRTINDPKLPFSTTVNLTTARARLRAKGTSGSGTLTIRVGVSDLIGPREQLQRFCP